MIKTITGKIDFLEFLRGKDATFMLALSTTKTCHIEGITQAGIANFLHLTPILDAEFLCMSSIRSLNEIAKTPKGVPTPALISRAIHLLKPFKNISLLDLGLEHLPKVEYFDIYSFGIKPSGRIDESANIDAEKLFELGINFANGYNLKTDYIILAESTPAGTTTAEASALSLGYDCFGKFSSSFKSVPNDIKQATVKKALKLAEKMSSLFDKLSVVSDNMLIFCAGFVYAIAKRGVKIVLAGGTQMASLLMILNRIKEDIDAKNISLWTTKWVAEDKNSDIKSLLNMLDFEINSYYSDFDFGLSQISPLKLYDEGEAKEGVGAGAALIYGELNGLTKESVTKKVEEFFV